MAPEQSPYQILEIPVSATEKEIRKLYRRLAMKYPPDCNPHDPDAEEKFKQIQRAYETFSGESRMQGNIHGATYRWGSDGPFSDSIDPFFSFYMAVATRFRDKAVQFERDAFTINDMLGFKIIAEKEELDVISDRLKEKPGFKIVEIQDLIEYLLTLAMGPVLDVPELPIKPYGRYLPETIGAVKCALFGNDIDGSLLNAFCLVSGCTEGFCLPTSRETSIPAPV